MGDAYVAHFVEGTFMDPVFLQLRDELIYIDDIRCNMLHHQPPAILSKKQMFFSSLLYSQCLSPISSRWIGGWTPCFVQVRLMGTFLQSSKQGKAMCHQMILGEFFPLNFSFFTVNWIVVQNWRWQDELNGKSVWLHRTMNMSDTDPFTHLQGSWVMAKLRSLHHS